MINKLRALRESQGLTQVQLAEKAGIPQATISMIETGARRPSLDVAIRLASALAVTVDELVSDTEAQTI